MDYTIEPSYGRTKSGAVIVYVRPALPCRNRSRKCTVDKAHQIGEKHYLGCRYFLVDGIVIGAKNEELALKEYWRVCAPTLVGFTGFEIKEIEHPANPEKSVFESEL